MGAKLSGPAGQAGDTINQNADINVTPFVDIMLVLLIIFMVAAPMATVSLKLDLPPAPLNQLPPPTEPVFVTLQESGSIFVGAKETTRAGLAADVCAALGGGACTDERVFLQAQPEVSYDAFMSVMGDLRSAGFTQIGLVNEDID